MTLDPEAPVRPWDEMWIDDVDLPADRVGRRRAAVCEAVAHATPVTHDARGAIGVCRYAPGCIALALRGRFDRVAGDLLRALADELPRIAEHELVIDLSGLEHCDALLARVIGRLRIRCLTREATVELHDPPPGLAAELGPTSGR
jgi:anti-anti-sigma regulatory factor